MCEVVHNVVFLFSYWTTKFCKAFVRWIDIVFSYWEEWNLVGFCCSGFYAHHLLGLLSVPAFVQVCGVIWLELLYGTFLWLLVYVSAFDNHVVKFFCVSVSDNDKFNEWNGFRFLYVACSNFNVGPYFSTLILSSCLLYTSRCV